MKNFEQNNIIYKITLLFNLFFYTQKIQWMQILSFLRNFGTYIVHCAL